MSVSQAVYEGLILRLQDLRAELAATRRDYDTLKRAVNESTNECGPDCDEHGHGDNCPANSSARWLEDQQREIERLRELLAAANERAGKLNRRLVELQDAIDSRDKALGFTEITPDSGDERNG
jgi:predicted nuclease with TOPRIM domain